MKTRAYLDQYDKVQVTAWSVANERNRLHRGGSTGRMYYSLHPPGRRKLMSHVYRRDCAPHFKYVNAADEHSGGPGESLEHQLFKEAVASMAGTTLKLGKLGNHRVTVTHGETEKGIEHPESLRRADVFLRFECQTGLGLKWGGEVYLEIMHTHAVEKEKLDIVRSLRLPMVEVSIPPSLLYEYDAENTTDEREAAYVDRIKRMLKGATGFLACDVLNNPSTIEYMDQELLVVRNALADSENARAAAEVRVAELSASVVQLEGDARALTRRMAVANERAVASAEKANEATKEADLLRRKLAERDDELGNLRERQNGWLIDGRLVLGIMAVAVLVIWIIRHFRS